MTINCLIISDDFTTSRRKDRERAQDDINKMCQFDSENKPNINYSLVEEFDLAEKLLNDSRINWDCVMIDYGLLGDGDEIQNIEIMKEIANRDIPFAWIGGMPKHYIDSSLRRDFPRYKFMHDRPHFSNDYSDIHDGVVCLAHGGKHL